MISRRFATLALIALSVSLPGLAARAEAPLHVLTSAQTAPKTYLDHGRATGYVVQITAEALRRAGFEADIEALPWARAVEEATSGDAFITGFSRTPERDALFDYSDPVYADRVVLVTRRGADFPFQTLADLAGRSIGIQRGSSYGADLEASLDRFHVVRDNGHCERLKMLAAGRIDGAIFSGGTAAVLFNAATVGIDPHDLVVHPTPIAIDPNYIAVAKRRPDRLAILARLNRALASMAADGSTQRMIAAYEDNIGL